MLDFAPLNTLTLEIQFAVHGVPATITTPTAERAVETRVIWPTPDTLEVPESGQFQRRDPIKIACVRRDAVADVPRGTTILAAEAPGGPVKTWTVDGTDRVETDIVRVIVVEVEAGCSG